MGDSRREIVGGYCFFSGSSISLTGITRCEGDTIYHQNDGQPNSLQQTIDGGLTWTPIKTVVWQSAQFEFTSEQVGWAIVSDSTKSILVHTVDGGKTWEEIKPVIAQ